ESSANKTYQCNAVVATDPLNIGDTSAACVLAYGLEKSEFDWAGSTINLNVNTSGARLFELRNSHFTTVKNLNTTTSYPLVGTAISMRRPSNSEVGYTSQFNKFENINVSGANLGFEIGVAGEGQTDQSKLVNTYCYGSQICYPLHGAATENIEYDEAVATAAPTNGVYFDWGAHTAVCHRCTTGSTTNAGVVHHKFEA